MPWYAWLIMALALGSILGSLLLLRDSAGKLPLSEEQLKRVHERNAEMDAKDADQRCGKPLLRNGIALSAPLAKPLPRQWHACRPITRIRLDPRTP